VPFDPSAWTTFAYRGVEVSADATTITCRYALLGDGDELPFAETSVVAGLRAQDVAALEKHVERVRYEAGQVLFREGDPANELFIIAKGIASAHLRPAGGSI